MYSEQCKTCIVEGCPDSCHVKQEYNRDFVKVVRCKDCKWFGEYGCAIRIVDDSDKPKENDYCSFAERRTDVDANT